MGIGKRILQYSKGRELAHIAVLVVVVVLEEVPDNPPGFALLQEGPAEYYRMEKAPEESMDEKERETTFGCEGGEEGRPDSVEDHQ
jgi:hypothetical protein